MDLYVISRHLLEVNRAVSHWVPRLNRKTDLVPKERVSYLVECINGRISRREFREARDDVRTLVVYLNSDVTRGDPYLELFFDSLTITSARLEEAINKRVGAEIEKEV